MSNSAINTQVAQQKIGNVQNQADSSAVYSAGAWNFKNASAVTSVQIDNNGNVGVGVTPSAWSSIKAIELSGGSSLGADSVGNTFISSNAYYDGTNWKYKTANSTGNYYIAGNAHIWRIADVGIAGANITWTGVGSISTSGAWTLGPSSGTATVSHQIYAVNNPAGTAAVHFRKPAVGINSGGNSYLEFYGSSGGYDGYLGVSGTTLQVIDASDSRKKENVRPANYGLAEVLSLKPVIYDWKEEFGGEKNVKGFLAQEVKEVLPECVTTKDETDIGGFQDSHYLGTANMIPVLVAAIQELSTKVDAQAAEIAALKAS